MTCLRVRHTLFYKWVVFPTGLIPKTSLVNYLELEIHFLYFIYKSLQSVSFLSPFSSLPSLLPSSPFSPTHTLNYSSCTLRIVPLWAYAHRCRCQWWICRTIVTYKLLILQLAWIRDQVCLTYFAKELFLPLNATVYD